jgi:hypothetical protein
MAGNKTTAGYWERLDITEEDLSKHPTITPILKNSIGSIEQVIAYLRSSDNKEALELVRLWDAATKKERTIIPFEGYCLAAKSTPKKMMGIIMQAIVENSQQSTELLLAAAHPEIVKKTIKLAKTTKGVDERRIVLQNRGTLPTPRNNTFNNFGNMVQDNRKQIANVNVSQLEEDNAALEGATERFNSEHIAQIAASQAPITVEVIDVVDE